MPAATVEHFPRATARQDAFIARLSEQIFGADAPTTFDARCEAAQAITEMRDETCSLRRGIDALVRIAGSAIPEQPGFRPNSYAGACAVCHNRVEAGEGRLERGASGNWIVLHVKECPEAPATSPTTFNESLTISEDGIYIVPSDDPARQDAVYRIRYFNPGRSPRRVQRGTVMADPSRRSGHRIRWTRHWQALRTLRPDQRVTPEQAGAFGHRWGICISCCADLSDPRSVDLGYGPVCARRMGWPVPY